MKTLVIIPAYNEEESILRVVRNLENADIDCDYVVINDCSKDSTGKILDDNNINHIDLPVNLGLTGAVQTGYKYAYYNNYDAAIQFDGDGQHLPEYIPSLVKEIENGKEQKRLYITSHCTLLQFFGSCTKASSCRTERFH